MVPTESDYGGSRILAVDSEPMTRMQLEHQLNALGYKVTTACSAKEAQDILARDGSGLFDCLITDCWMPDQSGPDLLLWLSSLDPTLASIIVSQSTDKNVLTRTLRSGASDFLSKPVLTEELQDSLHRALKSTERRRRHAATTSAVREAGLVQRRMNNPGSDARLPMGLTICYHPCHEAGGDSVSFFALDATKAMVVIADVSGHDLKSAFISAYFQGMLRGMVEQQTPIAEILERFNRFLVCEWNARDSEGDSSQEITSLSVCSAIVDLEAGSMNILNSGFPLANRVDVRGEPRPCGEVGGNPLGWFEPNPLSELRLSLEGVDRLIVWTDGLEEFAHRLGINKWSLAFRILCARKAGETPAWFSEAPDDVLLIVAGLCKEHPESNRFPILDADYEPSETTQIDDLQSEWRQSLSFVFPLLPDDRLSDIVLCAREGVLNALQHGCPAPSDRCRLTMVFDDVRNELVVVISDPGAGHDFDVQSRLEDDLPEGHRGLLLMYGLPERVERSSSGAVVRMYFQMDLEVR